MLVICYILNLYEIALIIWDKHIINYYFIFLALKLYKDT